MVSVFNIEPDMIPFKDQNRYNCFDFLNILKSKYGIYVNPYYQLLNDQEDFKLRNIFNYVFLRTMKINKKFKKINVMKKLNKNIDKITFNQLLNEYINNDDIKAIIVANSIQLYFYPKL